KNVEWPTPCAIQKDNEALLNLLKNIPKEAKGIRFQTEDLAKKLDRYLQYTLLYRQWSSIAHAVDVSRFIARSRDGGEGVRSLRNAQEMLLVACMAVSFLFDATISLVAKLLPDDRLSFGEWCVREVHARYEALEAHLRLCGVPG
ncbi:MAG: hypothetical protein V1772_06860, partial [Chloroflexota bacterium]